MQNKLRELKDKANKLPLSPGVYIMKDCHDTILYVGKAINLHSRVRSYFRENIGRGPWIDRMVSLIHHFEYIVTDSERGYKDMAHSLDVRNTYQLYRSYLDNFKINHRR